MMAEDDTRPDAAPTVSVIVPCGGRLDDVETLTESLRAQDIQLCWETIFVDNGLAPRERARLEGAVRGLPEVRIVGEARPGISPARNTGASVARGAVLAFIDADDVAASTWLTALTAAVAPGRIAAGDLDLDRLNPPWLAQTRGARHRGGTYLCEGLFPVAAGGNMAITKEDFDELGGFDPAVETLEDFELCFRAWRRGIVVQPAGTSATVHYRLRRDAVVLFRQGFRYGRARARVYRLLADDGLVRRVSMSGWKSWVMLVVTAPLAVFSRTRRGATAWILGNRIGRVAGSIRYRVLYV